MGLGLNNELMDKDIDRIDKVMIFYALENNNASILQRLMKSNIMK